MKWVNITVGPPTLNRIALSPEQQLFVAKDGPYEFIYLFDDTPIYDPKKVPQWLAAFQRILGIQDDCTVLLKDAIAKFQAAGEQYGDERDAAIRLLRRGVDRWEEKHVEWYQEHEKWGLVKVGVQRMRTDVGGA
jgi:hypothetical protein